MILLLSRERAPAVPEELGRLGDVRVFRVPALPKDAGRRTAGVDWAQRRLAALRPLIAGGDVELVTCAEDAAWAFAWRVAEAFPDVPVLSDSAVAARTLGLLRERGLPATTASVRALLDAQRTPAILAPDYLVDRSGRRPLVVSLVNNTVEGDSRVLKVARSMTRFGYDSVVVGQAPNASPQGDYFVFGTALVLRPPVGLDRLAAQLAAPPGGPLVRLLGYRSEADEVAAAHRAELRGTGGRSARLRRRFTTLRSTISRSNREAFFTLGPRTPAHRLHASLVRRGIGRGTPQQAYPAIADFAEAMTPVVVALQPDVLHVHDPVVLEAAVEARRILQEVGHPVRLVYDAHEWTPSLERAHALHVAAASRSEEQHVPTADAIVTVSEPIAARLQERFSLERPPAIVTNSPEDAFDPGYRDLRAELGLPRETPLLVYTGGIQRARGLDDAVTALGELPGVHLALVSRGGPPYQALQRLAREVGAGDRLHRAAYVPADCVASFIRNADAGILPFRPYLNAELGIPTKFREYLLAGLPVVASDLGLTAATVRESGVGEVYEPESPSALAAAVRTVLRHRDRYTGRITPELRRTNSWGAQEPVLRSVYADLIGPAPEPAASSDLLIAGMNSAGQATAWARALRDAGVPARSLELRSPDNPFHHAADVVMPRDSVERLERRVQVLLREVIGAEHLILESLRAVAAPEPGPVAVRRTGFREAEALANAGRNVGLIFHGSDLRRPDVHARTHAWSPFHADDDFTRLLQGRTAAVHEQLARWNGPVMVSTPDLIGQAAGAVWVPVVLDLSVFTPGPPPAGDRVPVVVHLPSRSALKGSALIDPVLQRLSGQGVIRYRRYADVPHESVPAILAGADILVDQLGMGIFGVGALEAMAMGIPVVTDPGPEALDGYGEEVPLVAVTPETLEQEMLALAGDPDRRATLAAAGPGFVRRHHDGSRSAAAMIAAMGLS